MYTYTYIDIYIYAYINVYTFFHVCICTYIFLHIRIYAPSIIHVLLQQVSYSQHGGSYQFLHMLVLFSIRAVDAVE